MTEQRATQEHAMQLARKICELDWHTTGFRSRLVELIAAHTASQLAGAVPQEELRALIAKWRKPVASSTAQNEAVYNHCAEELESLIEKRSDGG